MSKWPGLKVVAGLSAAIFLLGLGYLIGRQRFSVKPAVPVSENQASILAKEPPVKEKLRDPGAALSWLLTALRSGAPGLRYAESSRIMSNGRLSWKQLQLKGFSDDIKKTAAILESARKALARKFNYQLLLACDLERGKLNFLLLDGFAVVVVADFVAADLNLNPEPPTAARRPRVAIVIDDLGRSMQSAADFADLDLPLTFAVFPKLPESRAVAEFFTSRQRDIMLHLPMEPRDYPQQDPGPGAVFMTTDEPELRRRLLNDIASVPGIIGINNHMGSRLTEDPRKMAQVMAVIKGRGLFFLDSRTIADSVAYQSAVKAGIPALQRDVFLDNERSVAMILEHFQVLIEIARVKGYAVGIGHPYPETLQALSRVKEIAQAAGVEIVPVRKLICP